MAATTHIIGRAQVVGFKLSERGLHTLATSIPDHSWIYVHEYMAKSNVQYGRGCSLCFVAPSGCYNPGQSVWDGYVPYTIHSGGRHR